MSSEVTLQGTLRTTPRTAAVEHQQVTAPQAETAATKQTIKPVEKSVIDFDPKESQRKLSEAIAHLNEMMRSNGTNLNFSRDEALNQVIITVKNTETGNVIRQIPDATFLKIAHSIENLKGLLHNEEI